MGGDGCHSASIIRPCFPAAVLIPPVVIHVILIQQTILFLRKRVAGQRCRLLPLPSPILHLKGSTLQAGLASLAATTSSRNAAKNKMSEEYEGAIGIGQCEKFRSRAVH